VRNPVKGPERPSDLLGGILKEARSIAAHSEVTAALLGVLGPELAAHCRVTGMHGGKLNVDVDSAPLYSELRGFRCQQILAAMNERLEGRKVTEVSFRMGVVKDV